MECPLRRKGRSHRYTFLATGPSDRCVGTCGKEFPAPKKSNPND